MSCDAKPSITTFSPQDAWQPYCYFYLQSTEISLSYLPDKSGRTSQ